MIDFTPDDLGVEVDIDSGARSILLLSHLQRVPSIENISIFNSVVDAGIPVCLVPWGLEACSGYEDGLPVKGLLDTTNNSAMAQNFDMFHFMSTTIYLLSNRLVVLEGEALVCLLETLGNRIPRNLLVEILSTPLPAMRAAWELMICFEEIASFDGLFGLLVDVGIQNEWLNVERKGHDYLYYAVRAKCFDAMEELLYHGCRADSGWLQEKDPAILKAIQGGHFAVAKLLMQYCDVNREVFLYRDVSTVGRSSNFAMFMYQYNQGDPIHRRGLKLFFEHGAKSDAPWFDSPFEPRRNPAMLDFYKLNNISLKWWPTILDYFFYADRSTYHQIRCHDKGEQHASSAASNWRSEILLSLDQSCNSRVRRRLRSMEEEVEEHGQKNPAASRRFPHLSPRQLLIRHTNRLHGWEQHSLLELLFIEQFLFAGVWYQDKARPKLIWDLLELDVDLNIRSLPNTNMTELLGAALAIIPTTGGLTSEMQRIFHTFCSLHRDSINWSEAFRAVVKIDNLEVFNLFASKAPNPSQNGATALLDAARTENHRAIDWLLALGVDIQSLAAIADHSTSENGALAPIQSRNLKLQPKAGFSPRMIDFLSTKGLHVESKVEIYDPLQELETLLRKGSASLLQRVKNLLHEMRHEPDSLSSYLLELCLRGPNPWEERRQRLEVFELCFIQGAKLSPGFAFVGCDLRRWTDRAHPGAA